MLGEFYNEMSISLDMIPCLTDHIKITIQALDTIERYKSPSWDCPLARAASTCLSMCPAAGSHAARRAVETVRITLYIMTDMMLTASDSVLARN